VLTVPIAALLLVITGACPKAKEAVARRKNRRSESDIKRQMLLVLD